MGVLFYNDRTKNLYWIEGENIKKLSLSPDNIIELPAHLGLTGIAIENKKSMVFAKGKNDLRFI